MRRVTSGLWIPDSARQEPDSSGKEFWCQVPGCAHVDDNGARVPVPERQAFHDHIKTCAEGAYDRMQAEYEHGESHAFTSPVDKERHNWFRKHAATLEGNKTREDFRENQ